MRPDADGVGRGGSSAPRALGLGALLALGINGIVGVGIFFTPNLVAALVPGTKGVWAYALTLLALLPVALTYARLGARFDRDGGPYVWAQAAYGEGAGFVVGCAAYASAVFSTSAVVAGIGEYAGPALGFGADQRGFALFMALAFAAIVLAGVRPSAWTWSLLTVLKLLPLLLLLAMFWLNPRLPAESIVPDPPVSWSRAVLLIVFSMQGFEIVPVPGSLVRSPRRTIPIATVGSLVLSALLYMLLHWTCARSVPHLSTTSAPLIAAAAALGGPSLATLLRVGTNISAIGIGFGMMAMTPRYLAALSAPTTPTDPAVSEPNPRTPLSPSAVGITLVLVAVLLYWSALSRLFVLSSVAVLFQYSVSVLSLARLALEHQHGLTPRDALPALFAVIAIALVARAAPISELLVMLGVLAASGLLWFVRVRRRR